MAKVGRNDPCPCGSGKKYKSCCLGKPKNQDGAFSAVVVDHENKQLVLVKDNVLLNHLKRDTPPIEESFDKLCMEDLRALSELQSQIAGITLAGLRKSVAITDELRSTCGQLLINALNTFAAAVQTLRAGYLLAPGILCRNVVETLAVIAHLIENPKDLSAFLAGKFSSSRAVTAANRMIPVFGQLYGNLSSQFAHIGALHHSIQPLKPFQSLNEPLRLNLSILRVSLWVAYATAELLFFDSVAKPRYWKNLGKGAFMYDPSETERAWQKAFLQDALAD